MSIDMKTERSRVVHAALGLALAVGFGAALIMGLAQPKVPPVEITNGNAILHCDVDFDPTCPPELEILTPGEALDPSLAPAGETPPASTPLPSSESLKSTKSQAP